MSAKDHAWRMQEMRDSGMGLAEIGRCFGVSGARVGQLTVNRGSGKLPRSPPSPTLVPERRFVPDADLLKVAHEARDEIQRNLRRRMT